jgi:hypothetical protein
MKREISVDEKCVVCEHPKRSHIKKGTGACDVFTAFYNCGKLEPLGHCSCKEFKPIPSNTFICPWCGERKPNKNRCSKGYCVSCSGNDF